MASPPNTAAAGDDPHSGHRVEMLPSLRRVRVVFGGVTIADSTRAMYCARPA